MGSKPLLGKGLFVIICRVWKGAYTVCRSIKRLRNAEQLATDEEITAAALQFVRKVSGYRVPSRANQAAFDRAVTDVAASTRVLLASLSSVDNKTYVRSAR